MKFQVEKNLLKSNIERITLLEILLAIFFYLSQIQFAMESDSFSSLFYRLIFTAPFAYIYFRLRSMFYYSIWTFNVVLFLYIFIDLLKTSWLGFSYSFILNLITLSFLIALSFQLLNPIFFPLISWWEYDFRNFKDLKLKIKDGDKILDARLCDLKGDQASIACFDELELSKNYEMTVKLNGQIFKIDTTVLSKRLYSLGRPVYFGIRINSSEISLSQIKASMKKVRFSEAQ
ncbi:MAG: hypothetical protein OHK0056_03550 [Bacteriovoracaceae bacterium]